MSSAATRHGQRTVDTKIQRRMYTEGSLRAAEDSAASSTPPTILRSNSFNSLVCLVYLTYSLKVEATQRVATLRDEERRVERQKGQRSGIRTGEN